jgi:serine/threonine-protein kinase
MPTKIGQFEIISEIAKSSTGTVYKANDPDSGQTIALKAIELSAFGEQAAAVEQALLQEVENVKVLSSANLTGVLSASVVDGQFCATMEYVQGNSIATMLARKEGFSIWDLLDIGRQLCAGLDHAASHRMAHYSMEPSKIMCGWDGTVKILSFGVSSIGNFVQPDGAAPSFVHYMSPEQVRGEALDGRSNLYSLGAIFYEMVTERKAWDGDDVEALRQSILEKMPASPIHLSPKVHPLLSDLIMKALAKDPAQRYQTGKALLDDLENCKEVRPAAKKTVAAPKVAAVSAAAAQSKFVSSASVKPQAASAGVTAPAVKPVVRVATPKAAAAAAGVATGAAASRPVQAPKMSAPNSHQDQAPSAYMSAAVSDEAPVETFEPATAEGSPRIAVDPMMAESAPSDGPGGTSFSEISELPPLKEIYIAPDPPPADVPLVQPVAPAVTAYRGGKKTPEKPKIQPREVAGKAIKEIKGVPPKLMMYALVAAGALILVIGIGVYIHTQSGDEDTGASRPAPVATTQPAPQPEASQPAPPQEAAPPPAEVQPSEIADTSPPAAEPQTVSRPRGAKRKAAAPVSVPGQLTIDSTPQGALVQLDGKGDSSWVTPLALSNLQPGLHSITVSKSGYATDTRSVSVASGAKATSIIHLSQLTAMLVVKSDPPGANIFVDNRDVGTRTPAQVTVGKGQHNVTVRMPGYLEESMNAQFVLGQTFNFSPTLRPLGNVDNIKMVGKMSKLFGKGGQAGQGTVSIHTQPKGAQIAINQHILDKNSPVDIMLDPGNYVIDITLSGYAPVHKVVTAEKGNKVVLDEVLQPQ